MGSFPVGPSPTHQFHHTKSPKPSVIHEDTQLLRLSRQKPNDTRTLVMPTPHDTSAPPPGGAVDIQYFELTFILDVPDFLIAIEDLKFSMIDDRRIADEIPDLPCIFVVGAPTLSPHPAAFITERFVKLANDEVVGSARVVISANVDNERGTKRIGTLRVTRSETHPPTRKTPRSDVTGSENQVTANKNPGPGPKRTVVILVRTNPDLANCAIRPNTETFVDLNVKVVLAVTRLEFTEEARVLGFVTVFRLMLLGHWTFRTRAARGLMTLGDFELASFKALFDMLWFDTALCFAGQPTAFNFRRTTMTLMVDVMFGNVPWMFGMLRNMCRGPVLRGFAVLRGGALTVLTRFRTVR